MPSEKPIIDPNTNKPAKSATKAVPGAPTFDDDNTTAMIEQNVDALTSAAQETVRRTQDSARQAFDQAARVTQQGLGETTGRLFQGMDQFNAFGKENVDAVVKSSQVFAKGVENLSREVMNFAQQAIEMNVNAGRALMGVKTVRELADVQNDYAKTSFDALVQESTKLSEIAIKTTSEAFEPINKRASAVFERFSPARAA